MTVYEEVQKALKTDICAIGVSILIDDLRELPVGWHRMGRIYLTAVWALDGNVSRLYIEKGILKADAHSDDPLKNEAIKWLTQQMAKVSSLSCMLVPGKRAYRRKEYEGWPCICGERFIVYANELAERGIREDGKEV
jgi:hypothetical protein